MDWQNLINALNTRADFVQFLAVLREDLEEYPQEWENDSLDAYLWSLQRWTSDMDGYFANRSINEADLNPWQLMAHMLCAARVYE